MRSYYAHLQKQGEIFRSSAIFPLFQNRDISTRLIFLGYWQIKRQIDAISAKITVRDEKGKTVSKSAFEIREVKAYRIEAKDFIDKDFFGSIEIEFFSKIDLAFPYPAVTVNYYGQAFSSTVHTAERTYNDETDAKKNSETKVPESGFNLFATDHIEPFITWINGKEPTDEQLVEFDFYNSFEQKLSATFSLEKFNPYEIKIFYPAREFDLKTFFNGKAGSCKVHFTLNGVFPRLLVGNQQVNPFSQMITHSYYDCKNAVDPSNFWPSLDPEFYPASLMLPLIGGSYETIIDLYPIFAPSPFKIDLEIYNEKGQLLGTFKEVLTITPSFDQFLRLPLNIFYPSQIPLSARLIARPENSSPIPSRIKVAIDIGIPNKGLPCNICTNLHPFIPAFSGKKSSFKWAPLLADQPRAYIFLMNSSPKKHMEEEAFIELSFYREKDTEFLKKNLSIPPQGFLKIDLSTDPELKDFFKNVPGWVAAISSNPYLTLYYFAENPSGTIGGDHGY